MVEKMNGRWKYTLYIIMIRYDSTLFIFIHLIDWHFCYTTYTTLTLTLLLSPYPTLPRRFYNNNCFFLQDSIGIGKLSWRKDILSIYLPCGRNISYVALFLHVHVVVESKGKCPNTFLEIGGIWILLSCERYLIMCSFDESRSFPLLGGGSLT